MVWFRLYFLDWHDRAAARDKFEADDDRGAITIAALLHDSFSDCSPGFELWQRARRLVPEGDQRPAKPSHNITAVTLRMQETVLEREVILQQSRWSITASKRLVARVDQLRTEVSRSRPGPLWSAPARRHRRTLSADNPRDDRESESDP